MCKLSGLILSLIARILLGAIFVLSSVAKLSSMESFELYVFSFSLASFDVSSIIARCVVIAEFLIGVFLLLRIFVRPVNLIALAFLAAFSIFLLWRIILGDKESCHCMGDLLDMSPFYSLIKNLFLAGLLALGWNIKSGRLFHHKIFVSITTAVVSLAVFMISPPDLYFRDSSVSEDFSEEAFLTVADSLDVLSGRQMVCFYSATCEHCRHCASKVAGIIRRHELPLDSILVVFMQTHEDQDSAVSLFYEEYGDGLVLEYMSLHPLKFLPLTNGAMPIVTLLDDGKLVKEYDYISIDEKQIASFLK